MKTVEGLLEKGLIEVANKQEELKVCVCSCIWKASCLTPMFSAHFTFHHLPCNRSP